MKIIFIFLLIFILHPVTIQCEKITLIGSQFIPSDSKYQVLLLTNKLNGFSEVKFTLSTSKEIVEESIPVKDEESFDKVELKLKSKTADFYHLNVTTNTAGKCYHQSIKLFNAYETPNVYIQFDKPIYKTDDQFNFRIFIMNNKLLPVSIKFNVAIIDAKGYTIKEFSNVKSSNFGIYENSLKIAKAPNVGNWKIQVTVADKIIKKSFGVHHPTTEDLEIFIDSPSAVSFVDRYMKFGIIVKDNTEKLFIGSASIHMTSRFKNSEKIEINQHIKDVDINGCRNFVNLNFENDLNIRYPTSDMLLNFTITVTDQATKRVTTTSKVIELMHKVKNVIQVVRKKYFKPSIRFLTKVKINRLNGLPDNSFYNLNIINEYYNYNAKTKNIEKTSKSFKVNPKNGEFLNVLESKLETRRIVVKLEFAGAVFEDEILPLETFNSNHYMQIALMSKKPKIGSTVQISVRSTGEMEVLHIVVFTREGIIYTADYPDAEGRDVYKIPLKLTERMKPESRILVFYVDPATGSIIYDELVLSLGFSVGNSLEMSTSENHKSNTKSNINLETETGSQVFITASDYSTSSIAYDNEISRQDIYKEVIHFLNLKFPNSSDYHLEKLNAFILNPLVTGTSCKTGTAKMLTYDNVEDAAADSSDIKYFPDNFINVNQFIGSDDDQILNFNVPNSYSTLGFNGISVHPQKGLTVVKKLLKTAVKNEISIKLKAQNTAFKDEILWIDVAVFNHQQESLQLDVFVSIENGHFVEKVLNTEYDELCLEFTEEPKMDENFALKIDKESLSASRTFWIQPDGNGDLSVNVTAVGESLNDKVTKIIKIEDRIVKTMIASDLIGTGSSNLMEIENIENLWMAVYGNLMGPAIDGLENVLKSPLVSDEERMLKFSAAIISHKYLKLIKQSSNELIKKVQKLETDISIGYQEALAILDKILNHKIKTSIWLASMTIQNILNTPKFLKIDQDLILNVLEFIIAEQSEGKFNYDANFDNRKAMSPNNRPDIHTAQIITAFMINDDVKDVFKSEILDTINYLKSRHNTFQMDYPLIIAAYTAALNNDQTDARALLEKLRNSHKTTMDLSQHNEVFVEVVSYKILTKILLKDDPIEDVMWLMKQRRPDGQWNSAYDTVLAMQALCEYAAYKNIDGISLKSSHAGISISSQLETNFVKLMRNNVKFDGDMLGYAVIYSEEVEQMRNTSYNFEIDVVRFEESREMLKLEISLKKTMEIVNNLIMLEVELPRGYKYVRHDGDMHVDVRNDRNLVIFSIKKLDNKQIWKQNIQALKVFEVSHHEFSVIKAYDYYNTIIADTFYYRFDKNEESCKLIEVKKASTAVNTTQTATAITSEAIETVNQAEKDVEDAAEKEEQFNSNIKAIKDRIKVSEDVNSNSKLLALNAVRLTMEARREIEQEHPEVTRKPTALRNRQEQTVRTNQASKTSSNRNKQQQVTRKPQSRFLLQKIQKRSIQHEENEAIRNQNIFINAQQKVNETKHALQLAIEELNSSQQKYSIAAANAVTASADADNAYTNVQNSLKDSKKALNDVQLAAAAVNNTINSTDTAENQMSIARGERVTAHEEILNTRQFLKKTQSEVTESKSIATAAQKTAVNTQKARNIKSVVQNAINAATEALKSANSTLIMSKFTKTLSAAALTNSIAAEESSRKIAADYDAVHAKCKDAQKLVELTLKNSKEAVDMLEKAKNIQKSKEKTAADAKVELTAATSAAESAKADLNAAERAAETAKVNADTARSKEAENAKKYAAQVAANDAQITNISSSINSDFNKFEELRNSIITTLSSINSTSTVTDRISNLSDHIQHAVNETSLILNSAHAASKNAQTAAELSQNSIDAVETTAQSQNVQDMLKDIKDMLNKINNIKEQVDDDMKSIEDIKLSIDAGKEAVENVKLIGNIESKIKDNLYAVQLTVDEIEKIINSTNGPEELLDFSHLKSSVKEKLLEVSNALNVATNSTQISSNAAQNALNAINSIAAHQEAEKVKLELDKVKLNSEKSSAGLAAAKELLEVTKNIKIAIKHAAQTSNYINDTESELNDIKSEVTVIKSHSDAAITATTAINNTLQNIQHHSMFESMQLSVDQPSDKITMEPARIVSSAEDNIQKAKAAAKNIKKLTLDVLKATSNNTAVNIVTQIEMDMQDVQHGFEFAKSSKINIESLQKTANITKLIAETIHKTFTTVEQSVNDVIQSTAAADEATNAYNLIKIDVDLKELQIAQQAASDAAEATKNSRNSAQRAIKQLQIAVNLWNSIKNQIDLNEDLKKAQLAEKEVEKELQITNEERKKADDAKNTAVNAQKRVEEILIKKQRDQIELYLKKAASAVKDAYKELEEARSIDDEAKTAVYDAYANEEFYDEQINNLYEKASTTGRTSDEKINEATAASKKLDSAIYNIQLASNNSKSSNDLQIISKLTSDAKKELNEVSSNAQKIKDAKIEIVKLKATVDEFVKDIMNRKNEIMEEMKPKIEEQLKNAKETAQKVYEKATEADNLYAQINKSYLNIKGILERMEKSDKRHLADEDYGKVIDSDSISKTNEDLCRYKNSQVQNERKNTEEAIKEIEKAITLSIAKQKAENIEIYLETVTTELEVIKNAVDLIKKAEEEAVEAQTSFDKLTAVNTEDIQQS